MSRINVERNEWLVNNLSVMNHQKFLEIGFGPGIAIHFLAKRTVNGKIFGIDASKVMLEQASRLNKSEIELRRIELIQADVHKIPYHSDFFDHIYSVNSYEFWANKIEALKEIRRVLKDSGRLHFVLQPHSAKNFEEVVESAKIFGEEIIAQGFKQIIIEYKKMAPVSCAYLKFEKTFELY
ncbi:MAG: class I SAM-dependent methyltransferase [Melioribacteraceae bacterium]|nr:class I SAM-dependent methyltransferase [Melioribacteraceae bacterium]MCF8263021.1 class I SAM-dependent methyltransferase [Melioribacteraceae bacterium]MCF8413209.1 class I SAM-dependent methyltransferase [Melioribacteraceae bacterium]MCF8430466.1 class I SAM-dependent methyltransferase [Melioribacteraceae bacterium]